LYTIRVSSPHGVDADFTVASAALALDLALRSQRAGLWWTAELAAPDPDRSRLLSLQALRQLAAALARGEAERELVDQIEWQHEVATSYALN